VSLQHQRWHNPNFAELGRHHLDPSVMQDAKGRAAGGAFIWNHQACHEPHLPPFVFPHLLGFPHLPGCGPLGVRSPAGFV